MKILNISTLKLNDTHSYYGGAIGNIAYNLLYNLSEIEGVDITTFVEGTDLKQEPPESLKLLEVAPSDLYRNVQNFLNANEVSVATHLYFHEPEYNPTARLVKEEDLPLIIGMCESPHPRLKDELNGVLRISFIRNIGKFIIHPRFRKTLSFCDRLIVVSEGAKKYYSRFIDEEKIRIIPYGVDLRRFKYTPLLPSYNILVVSRLIERRGLDYLIEAMPLISEEYPDATLHFIGDGPRKRVLQEKAENLRVSSKIRFHGNVSSEELVNHYKNSNVFCRMSFADGWNQPALEAMASGRPVICTDAPHNSMVINKKTGFLIPYGDVDKLSEKIKYIFSNHERAQMMGESGRKIAEGDHGWNKIARRYYEVIQEVV